jgi:vancomycin permeability regulator SanA
MKIKRRTRIVLLLSFALLALWFIIHTAYTIVDGLRTNEENYELALILGTTVNEDGSLSERLKQRLDCGLELYKTNRVNKILVSGALGSEGWEEAEKMRGYLIQNGIPSSDIYVDNFGYDTEASVTNCISLADSLHIESIVVVSQYFHITRTKMLFKKAGFKRVSGASPNYFELRDIYSITREFFAFYTEVF